MKFACEQCATKYSIADERVHGRVLKIRCKSCNHVITVREPEAHPAAPASSAPHSKRTSLESGPLETAVQASIERSFGASLPEDNSGEHTVVQAGPLPQPGADAAGADDSEWYVSFDGEQEGPLPLARVHERIRLERPRGKEIHCWKPGFFVWLPAEEVPEMARALDPARPGTPPPLPPVPSPARTTGSRPAVSARPTGTTGSQRAIGSTTGSHKPLGSTTGSHKPLGSTTGSHKPLGSTTGSHKPLGSTTGSHKPLGSTTGSQGAVGSATGPARTVRNTGSRPAVSAKSDAPIAPMVPVDSKPMPLPPPPEPFPSQPMGAGATRPEPHLYRRAAAGGAPTPILGREQRDEAPAKKPLFPDAAADAPKAAAAPAPVDTGGVPTRPNGKEEVSPFAAALAASAGAEPKRPDTGPVPLPPPPGDDLPISEPSGLLNLSHVATAAAPVAPRPPGRPIETFGGQTVTPASGPNGAPVTAPAPVVVMSGAAPRTNPPWLKLAALGGGVATFLLLGVVIYLLTRKPVVLPPPTPAAVATQAPRPVEDQPIAIADPGTPHPEEPVQPKHTAPSHRGAPHAAKAAPSGPTLSSKQKGLAALYADGPEEGAVPHAPSQLEGSHHASQVSQNAILAVVSQNHRSLGLCYERVLKHDNTLKHARVVTRVKIGISGRVTAVNVEDAFKTSEIGQCLVQTIRQWRFPPSDSEYETELPLILQAN